jgi:hypothetical protein
MSAPTKLEIVRRLQKLADEMIYLSVDIHHYGGAAEWAQHGKELLGAGQLARDWAFEILDECEEPAAKALSQPQRELLLAMRLGARVHHVSEGPTGYYYRDDNLKKCTAAAVGLHERGLVERTDVYARGHSLRVKE